MEHKTEGIFSSLWLVNDQSCAQHPNEESKASESKEGILSEVSSQVIIQHFCHLLEPGWGNFGCSGQALC